MNDTKRLIEYGEDSDVYGTFNKCVIEVLPVHYNYNRDDEIIQYVDESCEMFSRRNQPFKNKLMR